MTGPRRPWGSGTIEQRGPNKWLIRWSLGTDPFTGKQMRRAETLHGVTKAEAQRILNQRQAAKRRTSRVTLGQLIDAMLPELRVEPATRERYRYVLQRVPDGARAWHVSDIDVQMAVDLFDRLAEIHGPAETRKLYSALMSCWKLAAVRRWVDPADNPWSSEKIYLPKKPKGAGKLLTPEQIRALIAVAKPGAEHTWITLHIETGARPGEVRHLRWSQVDLEQAIVSFIDTKHHGTSRPVDITQEMVDDLTAWRTEQAEQPLCDDPYLFSTAADASTPWRREYVRDRWHSLRERAGIPAGVRLYDIRHTVNSSLAESGLPSHVRGLRAGNSARVNEDVYTHMSRNEGRAAAEYLRSRFGS